MLCEVFVGFFCLCFCLSVCDVYWEEKRILESYNGGLTFGGVFVLDSRGFSGWFQLLFLVVVLVKIQWLGGNEITTLSFTIPL